MHFLGVIITDYHASESVYSQPQIESCSGGKVTR